MGALKAGATVSVLDPAYPPDRQKILLDVAKPRFLIQIKRANEESGKPAETVTDFIRDELKIKATIPALELAKDGKTGEALLKGGDVEGRDCLAPQAERRGQEPGVLVGPDCHPTLSFTSGSEGRPKGVLGRHFSLTYYFPWMRDHFKLSENDRFTMLSGIAHDPIQRDIFTPLFLGAKLVIPPAEMIAYELLAEWMGRSEVTVTHLTPAMGQILVGGASAQFPKLRYAFFVGDLLTKKDVRKLQDLAPNVDIINLYGSTESQRAVSYFPILNKAMYPEFLEELPDIMPVGKGMRDVQLLVVNPDDRTKLCGVGEVGELFIRAGGLSGGYLGDDERSRTLNESKFLANWFVDPEKWRKKDLEEAAKKYEKEPLWKKQPWAKYYQGPRDRIYRTGDLGRMRKDGSVECTGRIDLQVKIRGFRIELGEIDVNLSQHPFVRENVTVVRRDRNEEQTLVTYYVPEIKRWLQHLQEQDNANGDTAVDGEETIDESMESMLRRFASLSEECKAFLATKVPKYAVPTIFIPLARMPLSMHPISLPSIVMPC
jgi:L-2-aminoadipate reductase